MEACPAAWTRRSQSLRPGPGPSLPGQLPLRPVQGTSHIAVTRSWGQAAALRGGPPVLTGPHSRAQPRGSGASPAATRAEVPAPLCTPGGLGSLGCFPAGAWGGPPPNAFGKRLVSKHKISARPPVTAMLSVRFLLSFLSWRENQRREGSGGGQRERGRDGEKARENRGGKGNQTQPAARLALRPGRRRNPSAAAGSGGEGLGSGRPRARGSPPARAPESSAELPGPRPLSRPGGRLPGESKVGGREAPPGKGRRPHPRWPVPCPRLWAQTPGPSWARASAGRPSSPPSEPRPARRRPDLVPLSGPRARARISTSQHQHLAHTPRHPPVSVSR